MLGVEQFLLANGWVGVLMLGGAWLIREERADRKAAQLALDLARKEMTETLIQLSKESTVSYGSLERAITSLIPRLGGRDG